MLNEALNKNNNTHREFTLLLETIAEENKDSSLLGYTDMATLLSENPEIVSFIESKFSLYDVKVLYDQDTGEVSYTTEVKFITIERKV